VPNLEPASPFADSASTLSSFQHQTILNRFRSQKTTHTILVVKHDGVRCGDVDAQPTCTRAQKGKPWGVRVITALLETIHLRAEFQWARRTVYAARSPAFELERPILSFTSSMNK